jgi:drug/metabolite transporter (DMT)-like permease
LLSGLGVVFLPTTAKLAYLDGSNVMTVALARGAIATVLLALIAISLGQSLRLPAPLLRPSLIAGLGQVFFVYGVYAAIESINISLALLILYLYPIVLAIHQHLRGVIHIRSSQWLCALVACCGLVMIVGLQVESTSFTGLALALMAMLAAVLITLSNVQVTATMGSLASNFYMSLWSLLVFLLALLLLGELMIPRSLPGQLALMGNGVAYCVAWVGFFAGARILGATRASMLSLAEPAIAAMGAWFLFGETYTTLQWFGFFIVLAALFGFEKLSQSP